MLSCFDNNSIQVSDVFGRKVVLIASLVAGAISYGCMPFAYSLPLLFACRIPVGIVKQVRAGCECILDVTLLFTSFRL